MKKPGKRSGICIIRIKRKGYGSSKILSYPFLVFQLSGVECKEFKAEVQQDYIRCYTDTSFGVDTYIDINLNYKEYYTGFLFHDVDFEIKSFEIRKREDDKPMIYLDMDGDGVYEKDCSEYLNELDYY